MNCLYSIYILHTYKLRCIMYIFKKNYFLIIIMKKINKIIIKYLYPKHKFVFVFLYDDEL